MASKYASANRFAPLDSDAEDEVAAARAAASTAPQQQAGQQGRSSRGATAASNVRVDNNNNKEGRNRRPGNGAPQSLNDDAVATDLPATSRDLRVNRPPFKDDRRPPTTRGRQFERHSGTGRGREMKKHGGGAHNWGGLEADGVEGTDAGAATANALGDDEGAGAHAGVGGADESPTAPEENAAVSPPAGERVIDYAEWQKEMKKKRAAMSSSDENGSSNSNNRAIGTENLEKEGYSLLHREQQQEEDNFRDDASSDGAAASRPNNAAASKPGHMLDLGSLRGRRGGGRGGAGGGRRGGSSGVGDEHQQTRVRAPPPQPKPNVADATVFPSL